MVLHLLWLLPAAVLAVLVYVPLLLTSPGQVDRYIRLRRTIWQTAGVDIVGKRVLDAGGGFGINALVTALLGAAEVHNLDIHRGMISTCSAYLDLLPFHVPVFPIVGDVAYLPYASAYFDIVISIEAISHYHEVDRFLSEASRVLKPGGTLIIVDTNNGNNIFVRRKVRAIWELFENGPPGSLPGHTVERPFVTKRRDIAQRLYPQLSEAELNLLARATSGLWGDELKAAFRGYVDRGVTPTSFYRGGSPIDPLNGVYIEYLFDPTQLGRDVARHGLTPTVHSYFGGARGGVLHLANRLLSQPVLAPLALKLAQGFIVVGKKR